MLHCLIQKCSLADSLIKILRFEFPIVRTQLAELGVREDGERLAPPTSREQVSISILVRMLVQLLVQLQVQVQIRV